MIERCELSSAVNANVMPEGWPLHFFVERPPAMF